MKLVDLDGLFDEKCTQFMKGSKKKRSPKDWEDVIPKLYQQFGDTYVATIKCTPKQYYAKMTDGELVQTLSVHLQEGISVPEFLTNELEGRDRRCLLPLLSASAKEAAYAVALLGNDGCAYDLYFQLLEKTEDEELKNELISRLSECANDVKARALEAYQRGVEREGMLEILSHAHYDDEVYEVLIKAFSEAEEWQLVLRAKQLAVYGDERALPLLYRKIEDESIGFVEFQELKYAVEALGGEYIAERDFTADKDFIRMQK